LGWSRIGVWLKRLPGRPPSRSEEPGVLRSGELLFARHEVGCGFLNAGFASPRQSRIVRLGRLLRGSRRAKDQIETRCEHTDAQDSHLHGQGTTPRPETP